MNLIKVEPDRIKGWWRTGGRIIWWASVAAAIGVMLWAIRASLIELDAQHLRVNGWMFLSSQVVRSLALFLNVYLWDMILKHFGGTASFLRNFKFYCYTNIVKRLPTPLWMLGWRIHLYERIGTGVVVTSMSTGVEILISMTSGSMIMLAFIPVGLPSLPVWMKVLSAVTAVVIWVACSEPRLLGTVGSWVGRLLKQRISLDGLRRQDLLYWNLVHSISWMTGGVMMYFILGILVPVDPSCLARVIWLWAVSGMFGFVRFGLPFLFAAREVSLAVLLSTIGVAPLAVVTVAAGLSRLCLFVGDLIWAGVALFVK